MDNKLCVKMIIQRSNEITISLYLKIKIRIQISDGWKQNSEQRERKREKNEWTNKRMNKRMNKKKSFYKWSLTSILNKHLLHLKWILLSEIPWERVNRQSIK